MEGSKCPKRLLNGPCGGGSKGICEVTGRECYWVKKYLEDPKAKEFYEVVLDGEFRIRDYIPRSRPPTTPLMKSASNRSKLLIYEFCTPMPLMCNTVRQDLHELRKVYNYISLVDRPFGKYHPSSTVLATLAKSMGFDVLLHMSCKHRDRYSIISDIMSLAIADVRNILTLTGDWPIQGKPVFDLDSTRLVYLVRLLSDLGIDHRGNRIMDPIVLHVGVAFNQYFDPIELEVLRLSKKIRAGAEFIVTQPVFDDEIANNTINYLSKFKKPMIVTIAMFRNQEQIRTFEKYLKIEMPKKYIDVVLSPSRERKTYHIESLAEVILTSHKVCGVCISTLGNHKLGIEVGIRILKKCR